MIKLSFKQLEREESTTSIQLNINDCILAFTLELTGLIYLYTKDSKNDEKRRSDEYDVPNRLKWRY